MSVSSGARILELVEWLASRDDAATLAEARTALALPKSSTLMLLRTLVDTGYAERGDDGRYRLVRLPGEASPDGGGWATIMRIAEDYVRDAVAATQESGFVAVLTPERRIRYLCKHMPTREIRYDRDISRDRIAHHVASGIAMLAASSDRQVEQYVEQYIAERRRAGVSAAEEREPLMRAIAEARARGAAVNLKGRVEGAGGIAAAVLDHAGRPVAAVNISGPSERVKANQAAVAAAVIEAARLVSRELARRLSPRPSARNRPSSKDRST